MTALLSLVAKLSMATALRTRVLAAIMYSVYRLDAQSQYILSHRQATKRYAEVAKDLKENQGLNADTIRDKIGLPCVHAFLEQVKVLIKDEKDENTQKSYQASVEAWNEKGWKHIHHHIRLFRVEKMYNSAHTKLIVHVPLALENTRTAPDLSPSEMWIHLKKALMSTPHARELEGIAPPGDLERQIQGILDGPMFSSSGRV